MLGGGGSSCSAARLWPPWARPGPPRPARNRGCSAWPTSPPRGLPNWAPRGPGTEGPLPGSSISEEDPKPAEAGAENAMPAAAGASRASQGLPFPQVGGNGRGMRTRRRLGRSHAAEPP